MLCLRRCSTFRSCSIKAWSRMSVVATAGEMEPPQSSLVKDESNESSNRVKKKAHRSFDFSMYTRRHIALKLAYLGWEYHGLAVQESVEDTIEAKLFESLMKTKLIEDQQKCNYSRCGRTDKGVSALSQVVSLYVRSNLLQGFGVVVPESCRAQERSGDKSTEIAYMHILNHVLPDDIRVLAWAPVGPDFNARFSCLQRTYKYFFPKGTMDIRVMQEAAQKFVGEHDFRNFCKMDITGGVTNFRRRILSFEINPLDNGPPSPYQMHEMTVTGLAFLWHQIRCMAGILFLIGNGLEKPEVIDHMLDLDKCPRKPQYGMASDFPLILYDCMFEDVEWERDEASFQYVVEHFQKLWTAQMVRSTVLRRVLDSLEFSLLSSSHPHSSTLPSLQMAPLLTDHKLGRAYKPLLSRPTSASFEERLEYHTTKRMKLQGLDSCTEEDSATVL